MSATEAKAVASELRPLCVDLDGTLIATDALWESVLLLVKKDPWAALRIPVWWSKGKAHLKERIADHVLPNPATLPYRPEVMAYIEKARAGGRRAALVTASDQRIADAVRAHLGVFDEAVGSNGGRNLRGEAKRELLDGRFGVGAYAYAGDSPADLPVWRSAGEAILVGASPGVTRAVQRFKTPTQIHLPPRHKASAIVRALRPHQWIKNLLLVLAPILAYRFDSLATALHILAAFAAWSLIASSAYVLNDLLDLEADRQHATKRKRPFAAAELTIPEGLVLTLVTMGGGLATSALVLPGRFTLALAGYLAVTLAYSLYLKRKLIVDVVVLAMLFTYRVLAGGLATDVPVSFWLLAFSMFFFTGLAFAKRYADLVRLKTEGRDRVPGRNYGAADIPIIGSVGSASGLVAVLVFCLYINSPEVHRLYPRPEALWLVCPVLLYWFTRVWFLAARSELHDDPIVFAIRDPNSYIAGLVTAACVVAARW